MGIWIAGVCQGWSVDPNAFSYSMNVTAIIRLEGNYLTNEKDQLAAFAGNECRGVSELIKLSQKDSSLAFLTVYSNVQSGETLHFKIYHFDTDSAYDALNELNYLANDIVGTIDTPYLVFTNHFPTQLELDKGGVYEGNDTLEAIGRFYTTDPDATDAFTYSLVTGAGSEDNDHFKISQDQLFASIVFDYDQQQIYHIRVASNDGRGGTIEKPFEINVLNIPNEKRTVFSQVITPNNDGNNDYFLIENISSLSNYELYIYNSEQELVYQTTNYNNDWNGNAKSLPEGTYYFVLKTENAGEQQKGFISIVR